MGITPREPDSLGCKAEAPEHGPFCVSVFSGDLLSLGMLWQETCPDLAKGPWVKAVGDLHVENFGTWRDTEGG